MLHCCSLLYRGDGKYSYKAYDGAYTICLLMPFGITKHLRVHKGEKPTECILCKVDLDNAAYASAACALLMLLHYRISLCK